MTSNDRTYRKKSGGASSGSRSSASHASSTRRTTSQRTRTSSTSRPVKSGSLGTQKRSPAKQGARAKSASTQRNSTRIPNQASSKRASSSRRNAPANRPSTGEAVTNTLANALRAVFSNTIATIVAIVVVVVVVAGGVDAIANMNKAYGNVSVNGIDVGGMTAEEIDAALHQSIAPSVSHAQVKVYASADAQRAGNNGMTDEERLEQAEQVAQAEQISVEQAVSQVQSWSTDSLALKATVPYEDLAKQALAVGREDGGILSRLGLFFTNHDITIDLDYDEEAVEALASEIDRTIGDARIDATVAIEDGDAHPIEGHDGLMVDRDWFKGMLSAALVSGEESPSFVAQVAPAPSRITFDQAQKASDSVNRALEAGGIFTFNGSDWIAYGAEIGKWTRVETVKADDGTYKLAARFDDSVAIPAVVKGAGAAVKSDNVTVKFAKADDGKIVVRTFGPGNIPEVTPAIDQLEEALYGDDGIAWDSGKAIAPVRVDIAESDAPAALTLDQAIELGIVTVIGEYTTEFSNYEGTENRNHNIKLAADILDNGIITANGGTWHFNDRTGDTNEEAGFWAAGSIIEGEYVDSIGGGICQVATTVFNAVYEAGLPIDMRFPHQLFIASYPSGRDAAVSYPDLDLWWSNDLPSDVLLDLSYTDTTLTAKLYSVYTGYTVESEQGAWSAGNRYIVRFEEDSSLAKDESYVKTTGVDGCSISVTRKVKNEKGEVISEQTFDSIYDPKDEVMVIGPGTDTTKLERSADDPVLLPDQLYDL